MLTSEGLRTLRLQGVLERGRLAPRCPPLHPGRRPDGRKRPGGPWRPQRERRQPELSGEAPAREDCTAPLLLGTANRGPPGRVFTTAEPRWQGLLHSEKLAANQGNKYARQRDSDAANTLFYLGTRSLKFTETNLIEKLFSCCIWLDGELQLRVHGGNSDVDLENRMEHITLNRVFLIISECPT